MKVQRIVLANTAEINSRVWTDKEDQRLMYLLDKIGENRWSQISSIISNKSSLQTFYRYRYLKRELIKNHNWTPSEDAFLIKNSKTNQNKWKFVQKDFLKLFNKYVPIFILKKRNQYLKNKDEPRDNNKTESKSTDLFHDSSFTAKKRNLQSLNGKYACYNSNEDASFYQSNKVLSNFNDNCSLQNKEFSLDFITEDKNSYFCKLMKLQEAQDYSNESERKLIRDYYNPVEEDSYTKELKKRPFIITKIPKHIKHSYTLKDHIQTLKNNNDQLVNMNYLLINTIKKLIEEDENKKYSNRNSSFFINPYLNLLENEQDNNNNNILINKINEEKENDLTSVSSNPDIFRILSDVPQNSAFITKDPSKDNKYTTLTSKDLLCFSNHWCWEMYLSIEKFLSSELTAVISSIEKRISFKLGRISLALKSNSEVANA